MLFSPCCFSYLYPLFAKGYIRNSYFLVRCRWGRARKWEPPSPDVQGNQHYRQDYVTWQQEGILSEVPMCIAFPRCYFSLAASDFTF
jgi:hypothetical protein